MSKCWSYCQHGGVCVFDAGHEGLHNSEYCTWSDEEAISEEEADAILVAKGGDEARAIVDMTRFMKGLSQ